MDILFVASKQKNEDRLYLRWCTSMSDKSFEEYKLQAGWERVYGSKRLEDIKNSPEDEQTEEEILAGVKEILG